MEMLDTGAAVVLVLLTACYVVLTWKLARAAETSGKEAASAARAAADVAAASNRLADFVAQLAGAAAAAVKVAVSVVATHNTKRGYVDFRVKNDGDTIWVHSLRTFVPRYTPEGEVDWDVVELEPKAGGSPRRVHRGEHAWFQWEPAPAATAELMQKRYPTAFVNYSLAGIGETSSVQLPVTINTIDV